MDTQGDSNHGLRSYSTGTTTDNHPRPTQTSSKFHHILEWKEEDYPKFLKVLQDRVARKVYVQLSLNQVLDKRAEIMRRFATLPAAGRSSPNQQISFATVGSVPNVTWKTNAKEHKPSRPLPEVPSSSTLSRPTGPSFVRPRNLPHPPQWRTLETETTTSSAHVPSSHSRARDITPTDDEEKENLPSSTFSRTKATGGLTFQQLDDVVTQCIPDSVAPYSFIDTPSSSFHLANCLSNRSPEELVMAKYPMPGSFPAEHVEGCVDDSLLGKDAVNDEGSSYWLQLSLPNGGTINVPKESKFKYRKPAFLEDLVRDTFDDFEDAVEYPPPTTNNSPEPQSFYTPAEELSESPIDYTADSPVARETETWPVGALDSEIKGVLERFMAQVMAEARTGEQTQ